ncbi:hypothetical protein L209DRAFT_112628 [Thermothelomyces heterothallicus CBS 203.75]
MPIATISSFVVRFSYFFFLFRGNFFASTKLQEIQRRHLQNKKQNDRKEKGVSIGGWPVCFKATFYSLREKISRKISHYIHITMSDCGCSSSGTCNCPAGQCTCPNCPRPNK